MDKKIWLKVIREELGLLDELATAMTDDAELTREEVEIAISRSKMVTREFEMLLSQTPVAVSKKEINDNVELRSDGGAAVVREVVDVIETEDDLLSAINLKKVVVELHAPVSETIPETDIVPAEVTVSPADTVPSADTRLTADTVASADNIPDAETVSPQRASSEPASVQPSASEPAPSSVPHTSPEPPHAIVPPAETVAKSDSVPPSAPESSSPSVPPADAVAKSDSVPPSAPEPPRPKSIFPTPPREEPAMLNLEMKDEEHTIYKPAPIKSLKEGLILNDRYLFQRELFNNDKSRLDETIAALDRLKNIQEAVAYLKANFVWTKSEASEKFVKLVKRRFS